MAQAELPEAARRLRWLTPGKCAFVVAVVMSGLLSSAAPEFAATHAHVSSPDGLNLRDAPSISGKILTVLPYNTELDVIGAKTEDGWYEVNVDNQHGYVIGQFLDFSTPAPLQGEAMVAPADGVRLRNGPSTSAAVITTLPAGNIVHLTGGPTGDGWYPVQSAAGSGWIDGDFLQAAPSGAAPISITWYGHDFDGGVLACGGIFSADDAGVAATLGLPCGSRLRICAEGNCIVVTVRDRGLLGIGAVDLSAAAFQRLAPLAAGRISGTQEVLSGAGPAATLGGTSTATAIAMSATPTGATSMPQPSATAPR